MTTAPLFLGIDEIKKKKGGGFRRVGEKDEEEITFPLLVSAA